ncbi:hypothetical protein F4X88_16180 [Candidatus Poribacteria bacterium]|nr:hypothetical protein [Candidatus Poribacteria bacterium]MYA57819.1 hypothetical protein [Candidatus Poribacteria bacterium]
MSVDHATTGRDFLDPVLKEVMAFKFAQLSLPVETQVEISRLPRTMDALVVLEQETERLKVHKQTIFNYFRIHNQIEFKGKEDPLTQSEYHLIRGRSYLYLGEKNISSSLMTVTIISARQPRKLLYHSNLDVKWESESAGHYRSTDIFPVNLFVCNELELVPKNYPLLLFATSKEKFRQFVERIVGEEDITYIYYASRIEPALTKEILDMAGKQSLYEKQLQQIVDVMGTDLLKKMTPEERMDGLTVSQRVQGLTVSQRVQGLTVGERLAGLSQDDLQSLEPDMKMALLQLLEPSNGTPQE